MYIFGEMISLLSISIEIYERRCKTYKSILQLGLIRYSLQAVAYLLLGGFNGMIITFMAIIRHLFLYKKKFTGKIVWIWIFISAVLNLYFANCLIDLFPFVATLQFTFMIKRQNSKSLKYAQMINTFIWSIYHIAYNTYIYFLFDVLLNIITVVRLKKGVDD